MIKAFFQNSRVKSFFWRTGMMCLAVVVGGLLTNIDLLAPYISPALVGILGLILGEVSKAINSYLQENKV